MNVQKNIAAFVLALLVVLGLGYIGLSLMNPGGGSVFVSEENALDEFEAEALLTAVAGTITVTHEDGSEEEIDADGTLVEGDTVVAEADEEASIAWPDGARSHIVGPATIVVSSVGFGTETGVDFMIEQGEVWTKVFDMLTENTPVTVRTQSTVAGIRGTEVYHFVMEDQELVIPYEHGIELEAEGEDLLVFEGEQYQYKGEEGTLGSSSLETDFVIRMRERDAQFEEVRRMRETQRAKDLAQNKSVEFVVRQVEGKVAGEASGEQLLGTVAAAMRAELDTALANGDSSKVAQILEQLDRTKHAVRQSFENKDMAEEYIRRLHQYLYLAVQGLDTDDALVVREHILENEMKKAFEKKEKLYVERLVEKRLLLALDLQKAGKTEQATAVLDRLNREDALSTPVYANTEEGAFGKRVIDRILREDEVESGSSVRAKLFGDAPVDEDVEEEDTDTEEETTEEEEVDEEATPYEEVVRGLRSGNNALVRANWDAITRNQQVYLFDNFPVTLKLYPNDPYVIKAREAEEAAAEKEKEEAAKQAELDAAAKAEAEAKAKAEAEEAARLKALEDAKSAEEVRTADPASSVTDDRPVFRGVTTPEE